MPSVRTHALTRYGISKTDYQRINGQIMRTDQLSDGRPDLPLDMRAHIYELSKERKYQRMKKGILMHYRAEKEKTYPKGRALGAQKTSGISRCEKKTSPAGSNGASSSPAGCNGASSTPAGCNGASSTPAGCNDGSSFLFY